jgi:predicted  nucleic acid-binding Zn-ribbon protein
MSGQVSEELILLNKKLEELLEKYNGLKIENRNLKQEIGNLNRTIQGRDERIKDLEVKYEKIKISGALMSGTEDTHEARKKINELVREIDRCVALLNK